MDKKRGRGPANPPKCLDLTHKYNVVKDGRLIKASHCIHKMRRQAMFKKAQLWHVQQRGHAPFLVDDYGR